MQKKLPKIIMLVFSIIFILQIIALVSFITLNTSLADTEYKRAVFTPNVELPGSPNTLAKYVEAIYKYAIGIIGILATVVMMWGGVVWITAGGNTERISNAKSWIGASLTGLVLALASYTILYTINPNLVKFNEPTIPEAGEIPECCDTNDGPQETIIIYNDDYTEIKDYECKKGTECASGKQCKKLEDGESWGCQ